MKKPYIKFIYWGIYALLLLCGVCISIAHLLPIANTSIFLLGLMWFWTGFSGIIKINPYSAQKYARKFQIAFAISSLGMGMAWCIISLTPASKQAIPMILIGAPFIIFDLIVSFLAKK